MRDLKTILPPICIFSFACGPTTSLEDNLPSDVDLESSEEPSSEEEQELIASQCNYFAQRGKVTLCHRTCSSNKRYVSIKIDQHGCRGHAGHKGDYVAFNDPTCNGQGCFPVGAPFDGSVECCDGLAPVGGKCSVVACPANAIGAPACSCKPGYQGALVFKAAKGKWNGTCTDTNECAPGGGK